MARAGLVLALVCVAFAAVPRGVRADVVGPPPTDCVDGSFGTSCHGNEMCVALGCVTEADCPAGTRCLPTAFCTTSVLCYGRGGTTSVTAVIGSCSVSPCAVGDCFDVRACVHPPEPPPDSGTSGREVVSYSCCSCSVTTGARRSAVGFALSLVGIAAARRLRRRRHAPRA